jgi:hypothetical protein
MRNKWFDKKICIALLFVCFACTEHSSGFVIRLHLNSKAAENFFTIDFVNGSNDTIKLLLPQDCSFVSELMPYYQFHVIDKNGKELPSPGHIDRLCCYTCGKIDWTKLEIIIPPKATKELKETLPVYVQNESEYKIYFEYSFQYPKNDSKIAFPIGLWQGTCISDTLIKKLSATTSYIKPRKNGK